MCVPGLNKKNLDSMCHVARCHGGSPIYDFDSSCMPALKLHWVHGVGLYIWLCFEQIKPDTLIKQIKRSDKI